MASACRNVGFLHYFELKQLPNFLLAAPILLISASGIFHYFEADPVRFTTLGFRCATLVSKSGNRFASNPLMLPHVYLYTFLVLVATFVMHVQVATRFLATSPLLYWWLADRVVRPPAADEGIVGAGTTAEATVEKQYSQHNGQLSNTNSSHQRSSRRAAGLRPRKRKTQSQDEVKQHRDLSSPSPSRPAESLRILRSVGGKRTDLWELAVVNYFATYCILGCALFANYYPWT